MHALDGSETAQFSKHTGNVFGLLSAIVTNGEEEDFDDPDYEDSQRSNPKISTSLKIGSNDTRNRTEKVREAVLPSTRSTNVRDKVEEEVRSVYDLENQGNGTSAELTLPFGTDIAKIITDDSDSGGEEDDENGEAPEELPEAQELRLVRTGARRRPIYRPPPRRPPVSLNRRNVYSDASRTHSARPSRRPTDHKRGPSEKECTFFTKTVCLTAENYPQEAIMRSLRSNKEMVAALLTDYKVQDSRGLDEKIPRPLPLENQYENHYENSYESQYESNEIRRRSDINFPYENVEEGYTCPSIIKYARPQLARAASGNWKYIINIGEHTQTLRLEKCLHAGSSCSFISENYRSSCSQLYNYHRLLSWDSKLGLHMDIFKLPSCCSCHVHGYSDLFPPHQKDPPPKPKENFPGADFATSDQTEDFQDLNRPSYTNNYKPATNFDSNLVSSNKNPVLEVVSPTSRPPFGLPGRNRLKKPTINSSSIPRPFDKLPQQHAPNTRAPGYKGPLSSRPGRPNRPPFRRESTSSTEQESTESSSNTSGGKRYNQLYDQDVDASSRLQNGGFDDEYQEPQRRINYNYHPIIDFFKPEASMLQSSNPHSTAQINSAQSDSSNSWKPMISP
ncbi:neurotrophin 1 [Prorops nasuta]|uniref:neurotrophin 1 n=1 Tax=Prorops nasuta TaxID=863751 RepID=UPI0034CDF4CE